MRILVTTFHSANNYYELPEGATLSLSLALRLYVSPRQPLIGFDAPRPLSIVNQIREPQPQRTGGARPSDVRGDPQEQPIYLHARTSYQIIRIHLRACVREVGGMNGGH